MKHRTIGSLLIIVSAAGFGTMGVGCFGSHGHCSSYRSKVGGIAIG